MGERTIVHMDLDTFFVSVEQLSRPELRGLPVLVGGTSGRAVVASCSYEARRFGVHSGMSMKMAQHICPEAVVVRGDMERYSRYSRIVTEVIEAYAPGFEKTSIDEHYVDLTGMDRYWGAWKWARELRTRIIRETGLPISLGLSVNKTVAKIATGEAKPNGELQVLQDRVQSFLDPLPVRKIPMVGEKTAQQLRAMGISTVGTLAAMPVKLLERMLGQHGRMIWERARGIDDRPVLPWSEQKSVSTEETFEEDVADPRVLHTRLTAMVEQVAYELRTQRRLAACITVKIRYANFDTETRQLTIPYTASDHILLAHARHILDRLHSRRMRVRLLGVRLSHLVSGGIQMQLFEPTPRLTDLYVAMDRLRSRYGMGCVGKLSGWDAVANAGNLRT